MKIREVTIKGWRSYDTEYGVRLNNLKRINLLIGPNNSGKSNLFKYFFRLQLQYQAETGRTSREQLLMKIREGVNRVRWLDLESTIDQQDTWAKLGQPVRSELVVEDNLISGFSMKVICMHDVKNNSQSVQLQSRSSSTEVPYYTKDELWGLFLASLSTIDAVRDFERGSSDNPVADFDGGEEWQRIIRHREKSPQKWMHFLSKLDCWLSRMLSEETNVKIVTQGKAEMMVFQQERGDHLPMLELYQLGTGAAQVIMILSHLFWDRPSIIFVEEPESHLHHHALIEFISILETDAEFKDCQFFFSTHSSALLDLVKDDWTVYRVSQADNGASLIQSCINDVQKYDLLDELGIRPSQLLLSNLVIWVEGPSDRIYLKQWIRNHSSYQENVHYSFAMYGGSNLASYDLFAGRDWGDNDLIDMLRVSRFAVLVCDSDRDSVDDPYRSKKVEVLMREIDSQKLSDRVKVWVTHGREIENYIPHDLLLEVLQDKFKKHYMKKGGSKKELVFASANGNQNKFGMFDSFDEFFARMYRQKNGEELNKEDYVKITRQYAGEKVSIAREVVARWNPKKYDTSQLQEKIDMIVRMIRKANGY